MKQNGMHVLDFHVPAMVGKQLIYLRGEHLAGRLLAFCFLPYAGLISAEQIDQQADQFQETGATLLIVASGPKPLHRLWTDQAHQPWTAVLADPCRQLHRLFGVQPTEASPRCRTFLIDREGILRLRVTHDFVESDLAALRKIVGLNQGEAGRVYDRAADTRTDCLPVW
jgi:alkyl hydroperoxide reductase subunit AhpC